MTAILTMHYFICAKNIKEIPVKTKRNLTIRMMMVSMDHMDMFDWISFLVCLVLGHHLGRFG